MLMAQAILQPLRAEQLEVANQHFAAAYSSF
jgi:hypothetical protein